MSPATASRPARTRRRTRLSRTRLIWAAVGLIAVALAVLVGGRGPASREPLDAENPGADGLRAVARVLADQGVKVSVVRDADQLTDALGADADDATVVVTAPERLVESTSRHLVGAGAGNVVLLAPQQDLAGAELDVHLASLDDIDADCLDPLLSDLQVSADVAMAYERTGCFRTDVGDVLVELAPGVQAFGAPEAFTNDQVLRADNAAVALRLLGARPRVVFYSPTLDDMVASDTGTAATMLPRFLTPALVMLALSVLGLMVWRGRRFGPLASEPLPVVVQATESTRARGRMQRRSGDRPHVARILRGSTRRRLAEHLHVPHRDETALVRAVVAHLALPAERIPELAALLADAGPAPAHDTDLNRLADSLAALEEEVRSR